MDNWIDDLPVCSKSGVGSQSNQRYRQGGARREFHDLEDRYFNLRLPNSTVGVYGVFDGHEGATVAHYAAQKAPAELLFVKGLEAFNEAEMEEALRSAFKSVERGYFQTIDELLVKRTNLQIQIPEDLTSYETYQKYPSLMHRLQELDIDIQGGASALLTIVQNDNLYIANVGNSSALLCTKDSKGGYHVQQLAVDHTIKNDDELQRLANIGLDIVAIQNSGGIASLETTRSIGDFRVKGGYKEYEMLLPGRSEPVTSEPYISGRIEIEESFYFLALFTWGFYKAVEELTGPAEADRFIISNIVCQINEQSTAEAVAQTVVNKVCLDHQEKFNESNGQFCKEREDMTLLIRLFSANLRKRSTPSTPPMCVSVSPGVHSASKKSPDIMPVSIPFNEVQEISEAQLNKPPKLVIPMPKSRYGANQSSSQPNSRVSTPVTLVRTAATPPVAFYRHLSHVAENGNATSTSTVATTSSTAQSPALDVPFASPPVLSPSIEITRPMSETPLTVDVEDNFAMDEVKDALAIVTESNIATLKEELVEEEHVEDKSVDEDKDSTEEQIPKAPDVPPEDGKVDSYIDFTEFKRKIDEAGGEAAVFAAFMSPSIKSDGKRS